MHRHHLNELLARYGRAWPEHAGLTGRFVDFAARHRDCLLRTCAPGHITASAWILDASGDRVLLTHHRKLGRWLQLGGHVDGEPCIERAALREAIEESGLSRFHWPLWRQELVPLDLDVHPIPARGAEPEHQHWDVRFLLQAGAGQELVMSGESNDLRWFLPPELAAATSDPSVLRLHQKVQALRARGPFCGELQLD